MGKALQSFADLRTGDHVVHEDHGVGRLLGFETKTVAGVTRDYLFLEFKGDDRLYVPHEQIGQRVALRRRRRCEPGALEARRQGLATRQVARARGRARARRGADRALRDQRQQAPGIAYDVDGDLVEQLEATFPYVETPDQRRAIESVKEDLETPRPMDRLVCGDVGFGKTEVAVRAAFAVVAGGKQALVLAPTTILAQQHWNTFRERLATSRSRSRWSRASAGPRTSSGSCADYADGQGRHPDRNAPRALARRDREGSRARRARRGAALRRRAEGAPAPAAPRGRRARADRDADPAHAAHVARGPARHLGDRDRARGTPPDPHARRRVRRGAHPGRARARAGARRPGVLPPQPRRVDRGGGREAPAALPEAALPRRPRPARRAPARGADARVPRRRRGRARLDDDHRVRARHPAGEHAHRRARRRARPGPAVPDPRPRRTQRCPCTRVPFLSRRGGADAPRRAHGWRRSPTTRSSAPASRSRCATSRSAAPATCSAPSSPGTSPRSASSSTWSFSPRRSPSSPARGGRSRGRSGSRRRWTRSSRRSTSRRRRRRSTCTAASRSPSPRTSCASSTRRSRIATARLPEPVENLFSIQEAKLKLARLGADYLVLRGGKVTVGALVLGSDELRDLRKAAEIAVYSSAKKEVSQRGDGLPAAVALVDAILDVRLAA